MAAVDVVEPGPDQGVAAVAGEVVGFGPRVLGQRAVRGVLSELLALWTAACEEVLVEPGDAEGGLTRVDVEVEGAALVAGGVGGVALEDDGVEPAAT